MRNLTAALGLFLAVGAVGPAMATARAYVLIETASDQTSAVRDSLGSLANCLALTATLVPDEIVAHIECNDLASLNAVVTEEIAAKNGVKRATMWLLMNRE